MSCALDSISLHREDLCAPDLPKLLDVVKVMCFSVSKGRAAVHCHAGLGRTGTLIACYLVYQERLSADDAIRSVRSKRCVCVCVWCGVCVCVCVCVVCVCVNMCCLSLLCLHMSLHSTLSYPPSPTPFRPGSIQTHGQVDIVKSFEEFLKPLWTIYSSRCVRV